MNRMMIVLASVVFGATAAAAQQPAPANPSTPPAARDSGRARLESKVRERFARAVRQRVGLNDDQMTRLQQVTAKYEQQRRPLGLEERSARLQLRGLVLNEQSADAKQVDALLDKLVDVQKRRVALLEAEQRDLRAFMTPVQRAKYLAMREQVRRRVGEMRERRKDRGAGFRMRVPKARLRQAP